MRYNQTTLFITLFAANVTAYASLASAQTVPNIIPNAARPEVIDRQFRIEQRPEVSAAPMITVPDQGNKELKGDVRFVLKDVKIEGATLYRADSFGSFYKDKIGQQVDLGSLNEIASSITAYYRNKGYILSRAIVPSQRIDSGIVTIRILEGFVSDVKFQGDLGSKNSKLYSYAEKIKAAKPLNAAALERYLLLMEDLPGVQARAVIQPSPTVPGASQIVIDITRRTLEDSSVSFDNRGSRYMGPWQASATIAANNVLGLDEQTLVRGVSSMIDPEELRYVELRHEEQLGSEGTKVILDGNFVQTHPGYTLNPFHLEGISSALDVAISHPLVRSRQTNLFLNSDFSVQRVTLEAAGFNLYEDNLRVLTVGSAYDFVDASNAVNRVEGNISKGFNWGTGNHGRDHSRANGEADFWKATANAARIQPIWGPVSAEVRASGQYSLDPLYVAQEYALGSYPFGSAYDPAELTGDSGVGGRAELQYNGATETFQTYQLYGFYDIGKVWNRNIIGASEYKTASLASTGIGARFNIGYNLSGGLEIAVPLTRSVAAYGEDGDAPRFFYNMQYRY